MPRRPKEEKPFKKGDEVEAKWSGSNVYYKAVVVDTTQKQVKVQFPDGSVSSVKIADVKPAKSEGSPRGRGRPKTRSRSRSLSAGRKPLSQSPSRKLRGSSKVEKRQPIRTERNETSRDVVDKPMREASTSTSEIVIENSTKEKIVYSEETIVKNASQSRMSARIAALQATKEASRNTTPEVQIKLRKLREEKYKKGKYSDDEEEEEEEEEDETEEVKVHIKSKIYAVLSFFSLVLKIVLIPAFVIFFSIVCTKKQCSVFEIPPFYSKWKEFEKDVKMPLLMLFAFHISLVAISKLPIGKEQKGFKFGPNNIELKYRLNGYIMLLLSVVIFCVLAYYGFYINWGYEKIKQIAVSSVIYTTVWSIFLHGYSLIKKVDGEVTTRYCSGTFLDGFYHGLEINPMLFLREDIKTRFIHFGLIGWVLLNISILCKFYFKEYYVSVPLALTVAMQFFTICNYFWNEESMLSTATYLSDGVGFGFLSGIGSVLPSMFALQGVYLVNNAKSPYPIWRSIAVLVLFGCGFYLYLSSSLLKHKFRKNQFSSHVSHVESLPTSKKKRLIVSGWWGIVRHPNYLGLLVMVTAWTLPCGFDHFLPYGPLIMIALMLIFRIFRIETECQKKYGPAWQNYVQRVRSRLIPYVF